MLNENVWINEWGDIDFYLGRKYFVILNGDGVRVGMLVWGFLVIMGCLVGV